MTIPFKLPSLSDWLKVPSLDNREMKTLKEPFKKGLRFWFDELDRDISATTYDGTPAHIWSRTTDEELDKIVDAIHKLGSMNNPLGKAVAQAYRGVAETSVLLEAGMITGRNAFLTIRHYADHGLYVMNLGSVAQRWAAQATAGLGESASAAGMAG